MTRTLVKNLVAGLYTQGWQVVGCGGTWAGAMRPVEVYVKRKVERAVKAEREACAKLIESRKTGANELMDAVRDMEALAIRARNEKSTTGDSK